MSSKVNAAREAGYSDEEIADFLGQKDESLGEKFKKGIDSGYSYNELLDYYDKTQQPSRARSLISAPIKGAIKGSADLAILSNPGETAFARDVLPRAIQQYLPTQEKTPEKLLERAGELAPLIATGGEGLAAKAAQLVGGTLAGHIAKENDIGELGQSLSEAAGMSLGGLAKNLIQKGVSAIRKPAEKFASGLTKPGAVEARAPSKGIISPEREKIAIEGLNKEASKIGNQIIKKELPLIEKIQSGHDFEKAYESAFGSLKSAAEKNNVDINIEPLNFLLKETATKYKNIPTLHQDARKIVKEIRAFGNKTEAKLPDLLKIYRSNNQKIKNIYETSQLTGKQHEYVDFLLDTNRAITKSFEETLPKGSQWLDSFKKLNSDYREYKNSIKTLKALDPILGGRATPATLEKLSTDKKTMEKLALSLGEKGAKEIAQLSSDLKTAVKAIKEIPVKQLNYWDKILPLATFIPGVHGLGTVVAAKKGLDWTKRLYGFILATPSRRKAYKDVLKAIAEKDINGYEKAVANLLLLLNKSEEKE